MNDTLHLLETRRSAPVPLLAAPGPTLDQIERLLTLAARVPDHGKLAPWRFILFTGEARAQAGEIIAGTFAAANPEADAKRLEIERRRFSAPLVVGIVSRAAPHGKIPEWEQVLSSGAVCMALTVAANAMGFATSWLTEWYAYDRGILERFGVAAHEKMAGFVHIGTAAGPREDRVRPALAEIVTTFPGERMLFYEPATRDRMVLPHDPFKALVAPRPIGWVTTRSASGAINLAPYSFFNAFADEPPIVAFSSAGYKDSVAFIAETGEFVWNLPTYALRDAMNQTSAPLERGRSEPEFADLEMAPSRLVGPPRVKASPAAFECKAIEVKRLANRHGTALDYWLVLGEVVGVHLDTAFIHEGRVDTAALQPIARCGYKDYIVADKVFQIDRPRKGLD